jgi:hypothetical protein
VQVAEAVSAYLDVVDSAAPGLIEGLYIVGSYALDDWIPAHSDIDIVAVTAEPCTDADFGALRAVYAVLAERGVGRIDGPYVAWADLTIAPTTGLHRPWALDGEPHHDGDCFEINPVTWYTLQRYGVTVRGATPDQLGIWADTDERIRFVVANVQTYWADVAADVAHASADSDRAFDVGSFEWCALGALRLHYTAFTGDVTSKRGAGEYGLTVAPARFHDTLKLALDLRAGRQQRAAVPAADMAATADLISWVVDEVNEAR